MQEQLAQVDEVREDVVLKEVKVILLREGQVEEKKIKGYTKKKQ